LPRAGAIAGPWLQLPIVLYIKSVEPQSVEPPAVSSKSGTAARPDFYRPLIRDAAERHALAPALVESVIRVESNFQPRAVSR